LPKQEKQLVDFLILYPEFFGELKEAGLGLLTEEPAVARIINLLEQISGDSPGQPEQLLNASLDVRDRAYIVKLLTRNQPFGLEEEDGCSREMCDFLIGWMRSIQQKRSGADLQQQIQEAERLGNTALLMDLLRQKQETEKKRTGY
jgi:DNA primase